MNNVDAVIGNSSSGLIEAPTLGVATINIGDRQKDRAAVSSIINCKVSQRSIIKSITIGFLGTIITDPIGIKWSYGSIGPSSATHAARPVKTTGQAHIVIDGKIMI